MGRGRSVWMGMIQRVRRATLEGGCASSIGGERAHQGSMIPQKAGSQALTRSNNNGKVSMPLPWDAYATDEHRSDTRSKQATRDVNWRDVERLRPSRMIKPNMLNAKSPNNNP